MASSSEILQSTFNASTAEEVEEKNGAVAFVHEKTESSPSSSVAKPIKWNQPRIHMWRTLATFLGLFIMGANDGAYGALIPYLEKYYGISYTIVSLVFLAPICGYGTSALTNNQIHMRWGQRGIAIIAPGLRTIAYLVICLHPPYPVLIVAFILAGYGNGLEDAAWNVYIGTMDNVNELMGFLHGSYSLGATLSPLIATSLVAKAYLPWYNFYYIMLGLSVAELLGSVTAFWTENGPKHTAEHPRTSDKTGSRTKEAISNKIVWICAVFLLMYVGIEVSLGGWVVSFMSTVRHASPFAAGLSETSFWAGLTLGRIILGFANGRIGERLAILIYLGCATCLHLLFFLIPNISLSFVAVTLEGFFLGPLFPAAVVAATRLLPSDLHVAGIGFAAAFGAAGGTILPFAVGAIAQAKGVGVLMPIVLAFLVADAVTWATLPNLNTKRDSSWRERWKMTRRKRGERQRAEGV